MRLRGRAAELMELVLLRASVSACLPVLPSFVSETATESRKMLAMARSQGSLVHYSRVRSKGTYVQYNPGSRPASLIMYDGPLK